MKAYGINIAEGSDIVNLTVASGTSFPGSANAAEMFFRTDLSTLYVYDGSGWVSDVKLSGGTMTGALTATAFIPTSSSVPANGLYLAAANTVTLSTNSTEQLRIDSTGLVSTTGNVGVGTNSITTVISGANQTLNIAGSSGGEIVLKRTGGGANLSLGVATDNNGYLYSTTSGALIFGVNSAERVRIDASGNIYGQTGSTSMTDGFFYIPSAAGIPTGTPTAVSGHVPMYYDSTNSDLYVYSGSAWHPTATPYLCVRNQRSSGTNGGTTSTGNNTVPYSTTAYNSISGAALSSNIITNLPAGTYRFSVRQETGSQLNQLIIYNNTDSANLVVCESSSWADTQVGAQIQNTTIGSGVFTISATKNVLVRLWVNVGVATVGFGAAVSSGNGEVYGTLELWKIK